MSSTHDIARGMFPNIAFRDNSERAVQNRLGVFIAGGCFVAVVSAAFLAIGIAHSPVLLGLGIGVAVLGGLGLCLMALKRRRGSI